MALRAPQSLSGRLVATAVLLVAVVGLIVTVSTALVMRAYLTDQLDGNLKAASRGSLFLLGSGDRIGDRDGDGDGGPGPSRNDTVVALVVPGQDPVATAFREGRKQTVGADVAQELADVPADDQAHSVDLDGLGDYRALSAPARLPTGQVVTVVTGIPRGDVTDTVEKLLLWQVLLTLCGVAVAALAGDYLVRRTLRPLRQVAQTAHEVTLMPLDTGRVGTTVRVPDALTDQRTEVGQVGASLNRLLGHVEHALDARHRSEQQVRQFVADASHELRTPLATIKGYAELARRSPTYDPTQALGKVEEEAGRMSSLVDDLLLLARLDSGRPLAEEPVDLTLLLLEAVTDVQVVAPDHTWALDLPEEPVAVVGDGLRLHQVVSNLLGNARRHTPPGTTVTAGLHLSAGGAAVLTVADDGPGIAPELLPTVFERFTRGDASRTRDSGGAGLGLSLVSAIVAAHHGTVAVESEPGRTAFTVVLPVAAAVPVDH